MTNPRPDGYQEEPADGTVPLEDVPPEAVQPDTQGEDPLAAELGENGQGDVLPEDGATGSGDGPDDLRVSDLP